MNSNNFEDDNYNLNEWFSNINPNMLFLLFTFLFIFIYCAYLFNK